MMNNQTHHHPVNNVDEGATENIETTRRVDESESEDNIINDDINNNEVNDLNNNEAMEDANNNNNNTQGYLEISAPLTHLETPLTSLHPHDPHGPHDDDDLTHASPAQYPCPPDINAYHPHHRQQPPPEYQELAPTNLPFYPNYPG